MTKPDASKEAARLAGVCSYSNATCLAKTCSGTSGDPIANAGFFIVSLVFSRRLLSLICPFHTCCRENGRCY